MANIIVTGGQGFIGSNLTRELRTRGHQTWLCDIVHSRDPQSYRCDIAEFRQLQRIFDEIDIDYVYHAAAEYGRWNGEAYYENLWRTNAVGTKNILKAQKEFGCKMIFIGSAEVYGDYKGVMTEDVMDRLPIKQMNDYALSKWVNELQIINSAHMDNTESVRVRLFNVYGPHEYYSPYRGVVPIFIYRTLHNLPIKVYTHHKRTFEYVEDICRTLANIIDDFRPDSVYNLGSNKQYTIKELSEIVIKHTGYDDSQVTYIDEEPFTTHCKLADSTKAETEIGHKITVNLDEGIKRTVDWFRSQYTIGE